MPIGLRIQVPFSIHPILPHTAGQCYLSLVISCWPVVEPPFYPQWIRVICSCVLSSLQLFYRTGAGSFVDALASSSRAAASTPS